MLSPTQEEVRQAGAQLLVGFVVEPLDGGVPDRAVHALDLAAIQKMIPCVLIFTGK